MRPSRFPVLWFFVLTHTSPRRRPVGALVRDASLSRPRDGPPCHDPRSDILVRLLTTSTSPTWGRVFVGLLLTLFLYGFPGVGRLVLQLAPWMARAGVAGASGLFASSAGSHRPSACHPGRTWVASVPPPSWQLSELSLRRGNRGRLSRAGAVRGNRLARVRLASPPATVFEP